MYSIGDNVVYPLHGAGVIERIEEREIGGEVKRYYVMRIPFGDMKVLLPVDGAEKIGVRDVIACDDADKVIDYFKSFETGTIPNWNKRFRENMLKIKSGNIYEVAGVVKSLMMRDAEKGLSTGERKMLANAKQILISEIVIAKGSTFKDIDSELQSIVKGEQAAE